MYSYCYIYIFLLLCTFRSMYCVSLCCSVYCLCGKFVLYCCHRVSIHLHLTNIYHTHNTQPGDPYPKSHLPTRGNLRSSRPPSPPCMCGADLSDLHVHRFPPHREARPRAILKTVIHFVAEYGSTP
jgi:hypothetical protein